MIFPVCTKLCGVLMLGQAWNLKLEKGKRFMRLVVSSLIPPINPLTILILDFLIYEILSITIKLYLESFIRS